MTDTGTGTALLRAIIAQPAEDTPRLVYADYLDENGEPERAEFIRLDVERHRRWPGFARVCEADRPGAYPDAADLAVVESRLMELVESIGIDALLGRERFQWDFWSPGVVRGFVESLSMPAADWLAHADAILAAHPVERVTLTTWPGVSGWASGSAWLTGDPKRERFPCVSPWLSDVSVRVIAADLLRLRWAGVTFTLPPP